MLRNATVMHVAPSKCNFDKKPLVGTEISTFSQASAIFSGVRAQNIYLDIKMARLLTTAGSLIFSRFLLLLPVLVLILSSFPSMIELILLFAFKKSKKENLFVSKYTVHSIN